MFHAKAAGLERSFTRVRKRAPNAKSKDLPGCCPWCLAGTPTVAFECFDKTAPWMATTGFRNPLPWSEKPTILKAILHSPDEPSFLKPDIFHILNMGVYKEYAASGLCLLLPLFGANSQDNNMALMNAKLRQYVKEQKARLHISKLTLELIGARTPKIYASGGWNKGSDSVLLMGFVGWLFETLPVSPTEKPWKYLHQGCLSIAAAMRTLIRREFLCRKQLLRNAPRMVMCFSGATATWSIIALQRNYSSLTWCQNATTGITWWKSFELQLSTTSVLWCTIRRLTVRLCVKTS